MSGAGVPTTFTTALCMAALWVSSAVAESPDCTDGLQHPDTTNACQREHRHAATYRLEKLEHFVGHHDHGTAFELEGEHGRGNDRLAWNLQGEHGGTGLDGYRGELGWLHAGSTVFDRWIGIRHDGGDGPGRNWVGLGLHGLEPRWFELDATVYLGQGGRSAARLDADYEFVLGQRLILQAELEANAYGQADPQRGLGSGLADVTLGLRLRHEIRPQLAPYVGLETERRLGSTARLARGQGEALADTRWLVGLRLAF